MQKLLSLPPNLVGCFHEITGLSREEYFCTNDPVGQKLGSGGGTAWLLQQAYVASLNDKDAETFSQWLGREKRILLHAGGQSRRLPSYAPSGKILTPLPVFRWERGQRLSQNLLSLQVPLYEQMMKAAPEGLHTMIVSGDVYIRATQPLQPIPDADVVCYGLWLGPEIAKNHGVFVSSRQHPQEMKCMLQKPAVETLSSLLNEHLYLTDIGIWMLSDRAVELLMKRSTRNSTLKEYDLYGEFGLALGTHPTVNDPELAELKVAVLPLPGGEFYHFGTSRELISSMVTIQNLENDQRKIMHHSRKPHPAMFVQNAITVNPLTAENTNVWIENSYIGAHWTLSHDHIITGVPENDFHVSLAPGQCVDVVPIGDLSNLGIKKVDEMCNILTTRETADMFRDMSTSKKVKLILIGGTNKNNKYNFTLTDKQKVQLGLVANEYDEEIAKYYEPEGSEYDPVFAKLIDTAKCNVAVGNK
jgi:hypothetical protein